MNINEIIESSVKHDDFMLDSLKAPENQRLWLETSLMEFINDGNITAFIRSLDYVLRARGRGAIVKLAKDAKMDRSNLSDILHQKKTPRIDTLFRIVSALGYNYDIKLKFA